MSVMFVRRLMLMLLIGLTRLMFNAFTHLYRIVKNQLVNNFSILCILSTTTYVL